MKALTLGVLLVALAILCAKPAEAQSTSTDVRFTGTVSYHRNGNLVRLEASEISNYDSVYDSGTLYLTLWLTETSDPYTSGYVAARASLGRTLSSGYYISNVSVVADFLEPPSGTYYVHMYVSEYPNLSTALDLRTFTNTWTFSASPPPPPPPPPPSSESSVEFVGFARYGIEEDRVTLEVDKIHNPTSETTGTLHLTLRMTDREDPESAGHNVARVSLEGGGRTGQLSSGESYNNLNLSADYQAPAAGTYWVHIYVSEAPDLDNQLDSLTGYSRFTVASDDHGDSISEATALTPPADLEASLETAGDIDVFSINLERSGTLRLWTEGITDTYGTLISGAGNETLAIDDDGGFLFNFDIEQVLAPGTYYIQVEGAGFFTVGDYTLRATFEPTPERPPRPRFSVDRHLGDFNGDGKDDVLLRHSDGNWHYYAMDGALIIAAESGAADISSDPDDLLAGIGDFNGDSKDDVLLRNVDGSFHYSPMNGRSVIASKAGKAEITSDLEYIVAGIGDFNGDGKADVLLRHETTGSWLVYAMNGKEHVKGATGSANLSIDLEYSLAGMADFNGDGSDDVLLRHSDGNWYLYLMQGRRFIVGSGPVAGLPSDRSSEIEAVADLGGDGKADVLLLDTDGDWNYFAMNGREVIADAQGTIEVDLQTGEKLMAIGDLNGDGAQDLLFRQEGGGWRYVPLSGNEILDGGGIVALENDLAWGLPIHGNPSQLRPGKIVGTLRIAQGQTLDSDTLDGGKFLLGEIVSNNTLTKAQQVLVPVSLGGWASAARDTTDVYRIVFPAPVRISLAIADAETSDLDLYLSTADGSIVEQSLGTDDLEVIQTTLEGEHLVLVSAYSGASNYSLVVNLADVESGTSSSGKATWSKDGEFVPGELLIVQARPPQRSEGTSENTLRRVMREMNLDVQDGGFSGGLFVRVKPDPEFNAETKPLREAGFRFSSQELERKAATLMLRKRLAKQGGPGLVQPNYIYRSNATPNDEDFALQWHYDEIALEQAWDVTKGSDEVVVAVIDTGVVTNHPDIADRLLRATNGKIVGYDFVSDAESSGDGDGLDDNPYDVGDGVQGESSSFHGTHVAGTVGADTNNGTGVAGVMWNGKIMPVRVLGVGGFGTSQDVIEGIRFAAGLSNASKRLPETRADVINLSLGLDNPTCDPLRGDPAQQLAVREAIAEGVVVVHAAGNNNCYRPDPVSAVDGVISVGATTYFGDKANYSNYGPEIDVVAPGGDLRPVHSTIADDSSGVIQPTYGGLSGTSMAAPHMAGVVGLMLSANPSLTPIDINMLIAGTHSDPAAVQIVRDLGASGRDDLFGHGLIDAYRAVRAAKVIAGGTVDDDPDGPVLRVSPMSLAFGSETTRLRARAANLGIGSLRIESAQSEQSWIRVDLQELPDVVVEVNRDGLPQGTIVGEVRIVSNGGNATLRVSAQVETRISPSDIGTVYVALMDPDLLELQEVRATSATLDYAFQSQEVPPGQYLIIAGTDRDGDLSICDAGEACGMYPVLGKPNTITVDGDQRVHFGMTIDLFAQVASQSIGFPVIPPEGFAIPDDVRARP